MKRNIPKDITNYTNINPNELSSRTLNSKERELIADFIKKYNKKNIKDMIITICIGLFFTFLTIYNGILYGFRSIYGMFAGCAIFFIISFFISKKILPPVFTCKYVQVGQLYEVWSIRANSPRNSLYYFDVIFPDSLTRIKNVNCTYSDYSLAQPNDYILTFSYDGKLSYGCIFK